MFRNEYVGGVALALCLLLFSCESEQPTSPQESPPGQFLAAHITGLDRAIAAREGELRVAAFEASVSDEADLPAPRAPVWIWIDSGPGEVAPEAAYCDSSGVTRALYYVTLPYGDTTAAVHASAGGDTTEATVELHGDPAPVSITLTSI